MNDRRRTFERPRGEPLVVLALICGGWFALRVLLWQSPFSLSHRPALLVPAALRSAQAIRPGHGPMPGETAAVTTAAAHDKPLPSARFTAVSHPNVAVLVDDKPQASELAGHQEGLAEAFTHIEMPAEIRAQFVATARPGDPAPARPISNPVNSGPAVRHWTGDAWLLTRNGTSGPLAPGQPSYGRSQAGAVLRYRLALASGHRPLAYLRATRALAGSREGEVAAGLAARPLAGVPVSVASEVRISQGPAGREVRPAAFAVTELPPAKLPFSLRAEAYAQAGYVGGRFATAFVDGQARIDAPLALLSPDTQVRVGGGVWGGAQKHAARLDVGPSAAVSFRLGGTLSRVAIDYRLRVAGDAEPKSGPALTISAGF